LFESSLKRGKKQQTTITINDSRPEESILNYALRGLKNGVRLSQPRNLLFPQFGIKSSKIAKLSRQGRGRPLQNLGKSNHISIVCFGFTEGNSAIEVKRQDRFFAGPIFPIAQWLWDTAHSYSA
ncbi:MAG: hypothetical protein ACLQVY_11345, partial [Limisphaerales bacterium]